MNEIVQSATPLLLAQAHPAVGATSSTGASHSVAGAAHAEGGEHASPWVFYGFSLLAFLLIAVVAIAGMRRLRLKPVGIQNTLEALLESLYGLPEMVMGARGRAYAPFLATFFLYIMVMNFLGLVPFSKPGTASLSITLGLSLVAFVAVQYLGFRAHGWRYILHFMGPVPALAILIFPLELISELIRPVSLSFRLYGNIFGEEQVVAQLAHMKFFIPVLLLPLQLLTVILQAFVFTLLVTVYISMATQPHEEGHGH